MPKNTTSINNDLFKLLKSNGFKPQPLDSTGKKIPVPDEADVFQFKIPTDMNEDSESDDATVTVSIDDNHDLKVYYNDDATDADVWSSLLKRLKNFAMRNQLGFDPTDEDQLTYDMAKRQEMNKDKIQESVKKNVAEGYTAAGPRASYNDAVPRVKILVQHSRRMEEGEQRFRNVDRIFVENLDGERIRVPTNNTAMARTFGRLIAEGDKPYGDRWNHLQSLAEDYTKLRGALRATAHHQLSESAVRLFSECAARHAAIRESLQKLATHRGYHAYFEGWTPSLMEDSEDAEAAATHVAEMLGEELMGDARISEALNVLGRINSTISENAAIKEVDELAEWADNMIDETVEDDELDNIRLAAKKPDHDPVADFTSGGQKLDIFTKPGNSDKVIPPDEWRKNGAMEESDHEENLEKDSDKKVVIKPEDEQKMLGWLASEGFDAPEPTTDDNGNLVYDFEGMDHGAYMYASDYDIGSGEADEEGEEDVAEDLDANQKRVGQLGPTEKIGKGGARGKLVGANESTDPELAAIRRLSGLK
jgi:hypothetical protein